MIAALPLFAVSSHKLVALDDTGLESFFHSWRGASGRRYICSVYDIDEAPQFDLARAVVAAVRRNAAGTEITFTFQPAADGSDWRYWAEKARFEGTMATIRGARRLQHIPKKLETFWTRICA